MPYCCSLDDLERVVSNDVIAAVIKAAHPVHGVVGVGDWLRATRDRQAFSFSNIASHDLTDGMKCGRTLFIMETFGVKTTGALISTSPTKRKPLPGFIPC